MASELSIILSIDHGSLPELPEGISAFSGRLASVMEKTGENIKDSDAYVAGPPAMMPGIMKTIIDKGIQPEQIHVDSFGL